MEPFEPPKYIASLITAINDGAKAAQGGAFLFLLVGLYLLATAFSASDEDLLLGKAVTISQIGASLPVSFSFAIAPLVFVFLHIYALARYHLLAANVRHFAQELRKTVPKASDRERCRQLLANVEFIVALTTQRGSTLYSRFWPWLFRGIIAVFPVAVLLIVQINALRYQSELITNVQRATLALDLAALLWFFARNPLYGVRVERAPLWRRGLHCILVLGLPALLVFLNFYWLAVVAADANPRLVRYDPRLSERDGEPSLTEKVQDPLDLLLCPTVKWGCRFLRADHRLLVDKVRDDKALGILRNRISKQTEEEAFAEHARALAAIEGVFIRDRSLRFLVLDESRLYAADLIEADLRGASLAIASLIGANLRAANLSRADLSHADLRGANLNFAFLRDLDLRGADLRGAHLVGADLWRADLRGADLSAANLNGARLSRADLRAVKNLSQPQLDEACGTYTKLNPDLMLKPCPNEKAAR